MKASEKYRDVFGSIGNLAEEVPWTIELSNMVEWLLWDTSAVLGVSKTEYWKTIVRWCCECEGFAPGERDKKHAIESVSAVIKKQLDRTIRMSEQQERYSHRPGTICSPREALRRLRFFSEVYLNQEFNVFMSLASNAYLDEFYRQFLAFRMGTEWSTHGYGGLFYSSVETYEADMDNLAYNAGARVLVANELKLGGRKNRDQILKYAFLFHKLREKQFVSDDTGFLLLFIGDKEETIDPNESIDAEICYCTERNKPYLCSDEIVRLARTTPIKTYTWGEFIEFNQCYADNLDADAEVERKLLNGMNKSLREKGFMQTFA